MDGRRISSSDGSNWEIEAGSGGYSVTYGNGQFVSMEGGQGRGVAYGAGLFVALGDAISDHYSKGQTPSISTSTDGINWVSRSVPESTSTLYTGIYANGQFMAGGSAGIVTSPDGINWSEVDIDVLNSGGLSHVWGIVYGMGKYLAIGGGGWAITSTDGINWESNYTGRNDLQRAVTCGNCP